MACRSLTLLVLSALVFSILCSSSAAAQSGLTGGLTGIVTDPVGAVVPHATVEITSEQTGKVERSIRSEADGGYSATLLPPGTYSLHVTVANFKQSHISGVPIRSNETSRQDVKIEIGSTTETVQVTASSALTNPAGPVMGQSIEANVLDRLPLASPNPLFLLSLSSGTSGELTDIRTNGRGSASITVNGGRTSNNSISLEGINVSDINVAQFDTVPLPNPDVLQEFKVATSLYDASQGNKGAGALGLVLKSGSKGVHFDVYWKHRNDALNANEWFRNANGLSRARLLQNVFGGTASGPVPKAGGFWLFNYQGIRSRNGIDPNASSLSPIIQNFPINPDGTTSATLLAPAFGLTTAQIDPVAVNILNVRSTSYGGQFLIPRLEQSGCGAVSGTGINNPGSFNCQISSIGNYTDNQYTFTYDRPMRNGQDKLTGRLFWDNSSSAKPYGTASTLAFPRTDVLNNRFVSVSETHTFGATKVNEFRLGYSRYLLRNTPTDSVSLQEVGAARPNSATFPGIYQLSLTGLFSIGVGVNDDRETTSNQFNAIDTFSWTFGKHSLRIGGEVSHYQVNRETSFGARGVLTFGSTSGNSNTFAAFQNFLQGRVTATQSAAGDLTRYTYTTDFAAFFQDDYRFTPRLTMNLGMRWEGFGFSHDKSYRVGIYDPSIASVGQNPFQFAEKLNLDGFIGTPGVSECALRKCFDGNNLSPRVGFAWDVLGNQKTVVRGGFGVYFQRISQQNISLLSLSAPFSVQPFANNATPAAFQLANPFPTQPATPSAILGDFVPQATHFAGLRRLSGTGPLDPNDPNVAPIFVNDDGQACLNYGGTATNCSINLASFPSSSPDLHMPYTMQYNLMVQHDLGKGWAFEVGYVGSRSVGGLGMWDPFLALLASPSNPISVRDVSGNSYVITENTVSNEELRHQVLGLTRKRGSRYISNFGQANYNSLQTTVMRRMKSGLYFLAAYTFSKNIDNVSGSQSVDEYNIFRSGQGGANILNFQNDPRQNRAISDFDRPHRLAVSYTYDLPVPGSTFFQNEVFRAWSVGGIVTYQSGLPFSVTDSTSGGAYGNTGGGTATFICANAQDAYTPGPLSDRLAHYLNPACFTTAANVPFAAGAGATGYGNASRNAWRGTFQQNWDFVVSKQVKLAEQHRVQFRAEFFNLFNHTIFRFPSAVNIGTPSSFTRITETAIPARLIQFGMRYSF
jgi:hypothetical protein